MRCARAFSAVALAIGLAACNTDALPPAGQYASLSGVIVDQATNQPVSGATVTVDAILTATTGSDGKFSLDKVPTGDLDYAVSAPGYASVSASTQVDAGKAATLDLELSQQSP